MGGNPLRRPHHPRPAAKGPYQAIANQAVAVHGSTGGRFQVGRDAEDDVFAASWGSGGVSLYPSQPTIAAPSSVGAPIQPTQTAAGYTGYESNQPSLPCTSSLILLLNWTVYAASRGGGVSSLCV